MRGRADHLRVPCSIIKMAIVRSVRVRVFGLITLFGALTLAVGLPAGQGPSDPRVLAQGLRVWRKAGAIQGGGLCYLP